MNTGHDDAVGVGIGLPELIALRNRAGGNAMRHAATGSGSSGGHVSVRRSRGMEFAEARLYRPGDDVRHIDWRQTARRGKAYTKLFHEELERPVSLLVDLGPSMRFGTRVAFKSVVAARAAALLAWTAAAAGDRIGGVVWNGGMQHEVRPQSRRHGVLPLLRHIATAASCPPDAGDGLAAPVQALKRTLRPGSTVVLVSDFSTLGPEAANGIGALAAHADVLLLHIHDLFESAPPPGRYRLTDGRNSVELDLRTEAARNAYAAGFADRRAELERLAQQTGARLHSLGTHEDPLDAVRLLSGLMPPRAREAA
jgi:uncharacterized protein (DUF58 family)